MYLVKREANKNEIRNTRCEIREMKHFRRIFKYVWPQWPRIITVVISAIIVAALLSLSFMTVIPLLKVMMGKEGLHGWVDRKSCGTKYGVDLYIPDTADIIDKDNEDVAYHLLITGVKKNSLAESAGLKPTDRIVGVGDLLISQEVEKILFGRLLEELATTSESKITVQLKRLNEENTLEYKTLQLNTPENKAYVDNLQWGRIERVGWDIKLAVIERAQWAVGLLPAEQTQANKTKTIIFIILAIGVVTIIRCSAKFYQGYMAQKVVQVGINHLREDAFGHVMDIPMKFFAGERPSDTVSRIIHDTNVMGKAIKIMLGKALREPLNTIFMLGFAMVLNWQLTLIFICAAPLVLGLVVIFGRKMKKATTKSLVAGSQMLAKLQETMSGLRVVKVYNQQDYERGTFKKINDKLLKQLLKISKVDAATMPILEVLGMAAGSAALIVGVHWVTQNQMDSTEFLGLLILLGATGNFFHLGTVCFARPGGSCHCITLTTPTCRSPKSLCCWVIQNSPPSPAPFATGPA